MTRGGALAWLRARLGRPTPASARVESKFDSAKELAKAGRHADAEQALQGILRIAPDHSGAQFVLGNVLRLRGDFAGSAHAFEATLALDSGHVAARYGLAQLAIDLGDATQAETLLRQVLAMQPGFVAATAALGALLMADGRTDAALQMVDALPEDAIRQAPILRLRARLAVHEGRAEAAEAYLRAALALAPGDAGAAGALGQLLSGRRQWQEAADWLEKALAQHPGSIAEWRALAQAAQGLGRHARAVEAYARVLDEAPEDTSARIACAISLYRDGRSAQAASHLERVLAAAPADAELMRKLAMCYVEVGRDREAATLAARALALDPALTDAHAVHGLACQHLGEFEAAERAYDALLAREPDHADARWYRARLLLADGRWSLGWEDFAWRWDRKASAVRPALPQPRWGGEPLEGGRLLLYGEQGIGDEIMFASCVPDLLATGAACTLACDARLATLFTRSFPGARVRGIDSPDALASEPCDRQAAVGDLPRMLRSRTKDFPAHAGYLRADPERVEHWRRELDRLGGGPKIGISWRGGTRLTRGGVRSLDPAVLVPVLGLPGLTWVSLQYGAVDADLVALFDAHGIAIHHWPSAIDDYDETAALVSALDLVVSVCTAVVHLSGALGREAWVLTPSAAEWRYGRRGESMPWYPSVRLFRQLAGGDWSGPIEAVRDDLVSRFARQK